MDIKSMQIPIPARTKQIIRWSRENVKEVIVQKFDSNGNIFQEDKYIDNDKNDTLDKKITKTFVNGKLTNTIEEQYNNLKEEEKTLMSSFIYYRPELDGSWLNKEQVQNCQSVYNNYIKDYDRSNSDIPSQTIRTTEYEGSTLRYADFTNIYKIDSEVIKRDGTQKYTSSTRYTDETGDGNLNSIEHSSTYAVLSDDGKSIVASLPEVQVVPKENQRAKTSYNQKSIARPRGSGDNNSMDDVEFNFVQEKQYEERFISSKREDSPSKFSKLEGEFMDSNFTIERILPFDPNGLYNQDGTDYSKYYLQKYGSPYRSSED